MASPGDSQRSSLKDVKTRPSNTGPTSTGTRRTSPRIPPLRVPQRADYAQPIRGLMQVAGFAILQINPPDACAIGLYAEPIAEAVQEIAYEDERIAAILDKLLQVGPYGKLLGAISPLIFQIMANHGRYIKPGQLGTMTKDQLLETFAAKEEAEHNDDVNTRSADSVPADNVSA